MKRLIDLNLRMINYVSQYLRSAVVVMFCLILLTKCSFLLPRIINPFATPSISGAINNKSATDVIKQLEYALLKAKLFKKESITININSFGGSVLAGHYIISKIKEIQGQGIKIVCFANLAGSMAFTILQYCDTRVASTESILMQHMIHNGNGRENMTFDSNEDKISITFFDKLHSEDTARRMGISYRRYMQRYKYSKWYKKYQGCLDNVVDYVYSPKTHKWVYCASYKAEYDRIKRALQFYLENPKKKNRKNAKSSKQRRAISITSH